VTASPTPGPGAGAGLAPPAAAAHVAKLGFLAMSDLPDRPGPAYLIVALRERPTLHHFDPEVLEYWVTNAGRGTRRILTRATLLPIETEFSWGVIRITDRLHVTNEYLTFGGHLAVALVDGVVVAVFTSPAPLLRRGGHSQGWDRGADSVGAFFSRFLLAVDYVEGFEQQAARSYPVTRYAAFVADAMARFRASPGLRSQQPELWTLLHAEERRLMTDQPTEWAAGGALRPDAALAEGGPR